MQAMVKMKFGVMLERVSQKMFKWSGAEEPSSLPVT